MGDIEQADKISEIDVLVTSNNQESKKFARKRKWYSIDTEMIPAKLAYLFYGCDRSSKVPFFVLYLTSIGLSIQQTGYVLAAEYFAYVVGNIVWPVIADRTHAYRVLLAMIMSVLLPLRMSSVFVSQAVGPSVFNQCPAIVASHNATNIEEPNATKMDSYNATVVGNVLLPSQEYATKLLWVMAFVSFCEQFLSGPVFSFIDAGVIAKIKSCKDDKDFGKQVLFLSGGFAVGSLTTGNLLNWTPALNLSCYLLMFCAASFFLLATWISTNLLYKGIKIDRQATTPRSKCYSRDLRETLLQSNVIVFLLTLFIHGFVDVVHTSYLFSFQRELGASNLLLSVTFATGAVSGIVASFFTEQLTKALRGVFNAMLLCTFLWSVRFFIFGFVERAWLVTLLHFLLHGVSKMYFMSLKSLYLKQIARPSVHTTMFGVGAMCHLGVSRLLGSLAGGRMYQLYGPKTMFLIFSGMMFAWTVVLTIYCFFVMRKEQTVADDDLVDKNHTEDVAEDAELVDRNRGEDLPVMSHENSMETTKQL